MRQRCKTLCRLGRALAATAAVASLGVGAVSSSTTGASVDKTVVTLAEKPGAAPDYIFPFMSAAFFSVDNVNQFQYLMYRPLYYFGTHGKAVLDKKLSLARTPTYTNGDKTVHITLKQYKWSNGEQVTSTDVKFWINMWHAEKTKWAGWFPGGLSMPTSIQAVKITSRTKFSLTLDQKFNIRWLVYNELSQITPLPMAWDITAAGQPANSGGCAKGAYGAPTTDADCEAVYAFLSEQSGFNSTKPTTANYALSTYATNPLWQVVDGPWHLTAFGPTAPTVMEPNPLYSGPNKPKIKELIEKPFVTTSAEFNALVGGTIDFGFLPASDVTSPTMTAMKGGKNNPRLAKKFTLKPWYSLGVNYFPINFDSSSDTGNAGKIFDQLYIRQALQTLENQTAFIKSLDNGYAVPTYGPVPVVPTYPFASKLENPYPYSASKGKALLKSHGWKVVPGGTDTCQKPGTGVNDCGKGIPFGAKLDFRLQYASTPSTLKKQMTELKASWASAGIQVAISSASFNRVIGNAVRCPPTGSPASCNWEMENWGSGWTFSLDYYPTGEEMFAGGAVSNTGDFTTAHVNALIRQTDMTNVKLTRYEGYLARALPVIWQPEVAYQLAEIHRGLKGAGTLNPFLDITPATWTWR